jgi:hypothetical protein
MMKMAHGHSRIVPVFHAVSSAATAAQTVPAKDAR